jgi:hypothetical protein
MSLKEHIPGTLDKIYPKEALNRARRALGLVAITYHERLGSPAGRHSRTHDSGPRPDIGEVTLNAGYKSIDEVTSLPPSDEHKINAPELIERIKNPVPKTEESLGSDQNIRLLSGPRDIAPKGPPYPEKE